MPTDASHLRSSNNESLGNVDDPGSLPKRIAQVEDPPVHMCPEGRVLQDYGMREHGRTANREVGVEHNTDEEIEMLLIEAA